VKICAICGKKTTPIFSQYKLVEISAISGKPLIHSNKKGLTFAKPLLYQL
jgi:hypothetical protein